MFVRSVWIIIESVLQYKNSQIPSAAIWKLRFKPIAVRRITYFPANIRLNEDVFRLRLQKTSSRRLDQDEYVRLSLTSSEDVFKTSSRRLDQDEYVCLSLTSSEDVFKTSSRRLGQDQYIRLGHTSSRRLQDVFKTFWRRLQDIIKTSCKDVFKTYHQVNLFLVTRFQDVFETFSKRF